MKKPITKQLFFFILCLFSRPINSCPLTIPAEDLPEELFQKRTKNIHAYRYNNRSWHHIPIQIHLKDTAGRLLFDIKNSQLTPFDEIVIPNHPIYGQTTYQRPPCSGSGAQIHSISQGTTYLLNCVTSSNPEQFEDVTFDSKTSSIRSSRYEYQFDPLNQMLFKEISISETPLVRNADLMIRADFKNFFTFFFRRKHIRSKIFQQQFWDAGLATQINFFLKILFFKIELALSSDLFFYPDSGHIPMVLMLPSDADNYVHPGSGLLYSWENVDSHLKWTHNLGLIEEDLDPSPQKIANIIENRCDSQQCSFTLKGEVKDKTFIMHFRIPKGLVKKGFFPVFVQNTQSWEQHFPKEQETPRSGVYFEAAKLPKGRHSWSFWIQLNPKITTCPDRPKSIVKFSTGP